jgi:protein O-GlcNAc transferase
LGGDHHYTERLIRFTRLPCCFEAPAIPEAVAPRSFWGLPESGTLYACLQSLFKLHPEFDTVLAEIIDRDPGGHFVFLEGQKETHTSALKERWAASHPKLLERTIFLPRQPSERFLELVGRVDVLLDPIHFGSGNTMYEAMLHGTPIVSWPGRFMRGRIVAAAYAQMEIADAPVVERIEDYARMAVSLGFHAVWRENLRQRTQVAAREKLFSDLSVVRDFEAFLDSAVRARETGGLLAENWRRAD